ncbi:polysaccharide biosynthesis/export family protein [Acidobacteriia bacterium AH_259_A11_L15]|nr:polysaccharide biosynthesis/export family protein [Acidobacteriia bacterium AH_259_A11_L15]
MQELLGSSQPVSSFSLQEYRIGPEDLVEITVFEAPELNRTVRVTGGGEIYLPLLGGVQAAGLTPRELELVLQELLRRTYMNDPHVGVYVKDMVSHPVSVFGAVERPGVYQIRGTKTLLEILSMAEGLAEDAGDTVIVMREASFYGLTNPSTQSTNEATSVTPTPEVTEAAKEPSSAQEGIEINLKALLESGDPRFNIPIYPGDIVKVPRAGIVYVVGEVKRPGGFVLRSNENISVLQAIALGEGLTRTAAKSQARIIRTDEESGERVEIPIDVGKILAGKAPDPLLQPKDILYIPNSAARSGLYRAAEAAISIVSGVVIFRR